MNQKKKIDSIPKESLPIEENDHTESVPTPLDDDFEVMENASPRLMDQDLSDWISSIDQGEESYTVTLYKYDTPTGNERKSYVWQWTDETPTLHEIGNNWGSGKYLLIVSFPRLKDGRRPVRSYKFRIHQSFDLKRAMNPYMPMNGIPGTGFPAMINQGSGQNNQLKEVLTMMQQMILMLSPLIQKQESPVNQQAMLATVNLQNDIIKQSAKSNLELYRDMMANIMSNTQNHEVEDEEEEEKANGFLELLEPLLEKYLPLILGNSARSNTTIKTLKSLPQFKQVLNNKGELKRVIDHLDQTQGKDKTNKVLQKLKVQRVK